MAGSCPCCASKHKDVRIQADGPGTECEDAWHGGGVLAARQRLGDWLDEDGVTFYPAGGDLLADIDTVLRALDEADRA